MSFCHESDKATGKRRSLNAQPFHRFVDGGAHKCVVVIVAVVGDAAAAADLALAAAIASIVAVVVVCICSC